MPGMSSDSIASQPSFNRGLHESAGAPPVASSKLAGRVEVAPASGARGGVLKRIGAWARNILSCFRPARQSGAARRPNPAQLKQQFFEQLSGVMGTLLSSKSTSESLEETLLSTHSAALAMDSRPGASRSMMRTGVSQYLAGISTSQLNRLATTLGSNTVSHAQDMLEDQPGAALILMEVETAVNAELGKRTQASVGTAIEAAVFALEGGEPHARVTDHLHFALDSAASLVKLGVLQHGDPTNDAKIQSLVVSHLEALPQHTREMLIPLLSHGDLQSLQRAASSSRTATRVALNHEIVDRPACIALQTQTRAQQFCRLQDGDRFDHGRLVRDLSVIASGFKAIAQHRAAFGVPMQLSPEMETLRNEVTTAAADRLKSGHIALSSITAAEVSALTLAFDALGAPAMAREVLGPVQNRLVAERSTALEQPLNKVITELRDTSIEDLADRPETLLRALGSLEEASRKLADTSNTFAASFEKPVLPHVAARAKLNQVVGAMPPHIRDHLASVLASSAFEPVLNGLRVAEKAARNAHDVALAQRFGTMVALVEELTSQVGAAPRSVAPAALHPSKLSAPMRQTLAKLHELTIEPNGWVALHAGSFNAQQAQIAAAFIEQPASEKESKLTQVGDYRFGDQFLLDAMRGQPRIWIQGDAQSKPASLVDYNDWPSNDGLPAGAEPKDVETERRARVADGYSRLVDFCDGNEAQARTLTFYLQQNLPAGLIGACGREDSPLKLADGTAGAIRVNNDGGGGDLVDVSLSKGASGRPQIDVSYRLDGRNALFSPFHSSVIHLSPDSHVEIHYRAELDDGVLKLLAPPTYGFSIAADDFQKIYPPPSVASLRRANDRDEIVLDALQYGASVGKEHQIKALRAVDSFQRSPTALNAAAVLDELALAGASETELVPDELRQNIAAAMAQSRQGLLLAIDEVVRVVEFRMGNGAPLDDAARADMEQFLQEALEPETRNAADLLPRATQLFRKFIEPSNDEASARAAGQRPLAIDPALANKVRLALASAARPAFDPELFGAVDRQLTQQVETQVLPGMIEAVRAGKL